jgi:hypothetical protein
MSGIRPPVWKKLLKREGYIVSYQRSSLLEIPDIFMLTLGFVKFNSCAVNSDY